MFNFLHTFLPQPILISFGPITIHWYGLFIVSGILAAFYIMMSLADFYDIDKNDIVDIGFWIVVFGIIGARLYHVGLEWQYYVANPLNIIKIWNGGLAIHGAIIAGVITAYYLVKKYEIDFWKLAAIAAPGVAIGQAIGRWGNYFNQELYGLPTSLPWGIPIDTINKVPGYLDYAYFHPTFLYESIGNLLIFIVLISVHAWMIKKNKQEKSNFINVICLYLILYSILRFCTEIIRIDYTPEMAGLRFPQIMSLILLIFAIILAVIYKKKSHPREGLKKL